MNNAATAARPKATAKPPVMPAATAAPAAIPQSTPMALPEADKRKPEQLGPARLQVAEFMRSVHVADAAPGTKVEDLEVPEFWSHVAAKLKARDRVEVWVDDNAWMAECVVLAATRTDAMVKVLGAWDLNGNQVLADRSDNALQAYRVQFRGHFEKWGVVRKVDDAVVHTGEATEGGAWTWLKERLKAGI